MLAVIIKGLRHYIWKHLLQPKTAKDTRKLVSVAESTKMRHKSASTGTENHERQKEFCSRINQNAAQICFNRNRKPLRTKVNFKSRIIKNAAHVSLQAAAVEEIKLSVIGRDFQEQFTSIHDAEVSYGGTCSSSPSPRPVQF